jgi:hypothetical protein
MTRQQIFILAILGVLDIVFLCAVGALILTMLPASNSVDSTIQQAQVVVTQVTETATPTLPATATPIPATATLVFQSPTPRPTTQASSAILTALSKSQTVNVYRLQMDMSAKGVITGTSATQEMSLINMTAEVNNKDVHIAMKGMVAVLFTGDPNAAFEMMSVGGKEYVKGPMPLLGAKENKWYVLPNPQGTSSMSTTPEEFYGTFLNGDVDLYSFTKTRTESLDRLQCDVYSASPTEAMRAFTSLSPDLNLTNAQIQQLEQIQGKAELALWICADGFVHQMRMGMEGKDATGKTGGFNMTFHVYDFNSPINIIPPANPLTAINPFLVSTPTRTATPKK